MIKENFSRKIFIAINATLLIALSLITFLPFLNVVASSFAPSHEIIQRPFMLVPYEPTTLAYDYIFSTNTLLQSLKISLFITVVGTLINLFMTVITAYPLAHKNIVGRKVLMNSIIFTMLFSGGMIPNFILVKNLGLIDSLASLILPGAINVFNLIVVKNFFQEIPQELEEAARIDGANEIYTLWKIILPLSLPVLATFTLFYAVGHWNSYFDCLMYINDADKWNVQVLLRQIVMLASAVGSAEELADIHIVIPEEAVKMATIVVSTAPILVVYPFLQKHFAKGVLLGSVKG